MAEEITREAITRKWCSGCQRGQLGVLNSRGELICPDCGRDLNISDPPKVKKPARDGTKWQGNEPFELQGDKELGGGYTDKEGGEPAPEIDKKDSEPETKKKGKKKKSRKSSGK